MLVNQRINCFCGSGCSSGGGLDRRRFRAGDIPDGIYISYVCSAEVVDLNVTCVIQIDLAYEDLAVGLNTDADQRGVDVVIILDTSGPMLDGFDKFGGWAIPFHDDQGHDLVFKRPVVVEKLRWRRSMCTEEFAYLRARTARSLPASASTRHSGISRTPASIPRGMAVRVMVCFSPEEPSASPGEYR